MENNNVELLRQYKELLDQGILTQEEFEAKKAEVLGVQQPASFQRAPQQMPPQQGSFQQVPPQQTPIQRNVPGSVESTISTARTLGILAIVGALTITLGGLICGIIGLSKVNNLEVPPELTAQRDSAKRLNLIGIIIAAALMVIAIIFVSATGCSDGYYY